MIMKILTFFLLEKKNVLVGITFSNFSTAYVGQQKKNKQTK